LGVQQQPKRLELKWEEMMMMLADDGVGMKKKGG
jgi:hypothetical protein